MNLRELMDRAEELRVTRGAIVVLAALVVLLFVGWAAVGRTAEAPVVVALVVGATATVMGTWIGANAGSQAREDAEEARDRATRAVMLLVAHADAAVAREALVSAGLVEDAVAAGVARPGTVAGPRASRDARRSGFGFRARRNDERAALWAPQPTDDGDQASARDAAS